FFLLLATPLPIISLFAMFPFIMLSDQGFLQPFRLWVNLKGQMGHSSQFFKDFTVIKGFLGIFSPSKRSMVAYQHHFHFFIGKPSFGKTVQNLLSCHVFIIPLDQLIRHGWRTGYVHGQMIRMGGAENRYVPIGLCPGYRIGGMSMDYAAYFFPIF